MSGLEPETPLRRLTAAPPNHAPHNNVRQAIKKRPLWPRTVYPKDRQVDRSFLGCRGIFFR